jgi:hypothetical protein
MHQNHEHTYLIEVNEYRYVALCCHRAIHVQWDNLTLSWRLEDFRHIVQLIRDQMTQLAIPAEAVGMRVNRITLTIPTAEFYYFADMVLAAHDNLDASLQQLESHTLPPQQSSHSFPFSLN